MKNFKYPETKVINSKIAILYRNLIEIIDSNYNKLILNKNYDIITFFSEDEEECDLSRFNGILNDKQFKLSFISVTKSFIEIKYNNVIYCFTGNPEYGSFYKNETTEDIYLHPSSAYYSYYGRDAIEKYNLTDKHIQIYFPAYCYGEERLDFKKYLMTIENHQKAVNFLEKLILEISL